jgi:hypothetical protein
MKEITITAKRMGMEIVWIILCFIATEAVNLYAIVKFKTDRNELWTELPFILILMLIMYAVFTAVRILLKLILIFYRRLVLPKIRRS